MSILEIILLCLLYFISSGYLSTLYIISEEKLNPRISKILLMMVFVPGINTIGSLGMTFLIWYDAILGKDEADA